VGPALLCVLEGCSYGGVAPVESATRAPVSKPSPRSQARRDVYTVRRGDTLYSIAWHYGFDFRQLAAWNAIREPYTIYPGQQLRLTRPPRTASTGAAQSAPSARGSTAKTPLPAPQKPSNSAPRSSGTTSRTKPASSPGSLKKGANRAAKEGSVPVKRWQWPAKGKVITTFSASGRKGINIAGRFGQAIVAASDGRVVYSGSGLIGYGQLIIVKHNKRYLSAYAHNNKILVKEGDAVKGGQRIAEMGRSGSNRALLHFEIRRDGKPIDPLRYLPK
jgi:lipoprotein NlpD